MLDDRGLSKQLNLLRLEDADELKETLSVYERMETQQAEKSVGSRYFGNH